MTEQVPSKAHPSGSCLIGGDCDHVEQRPSKERVSQILGHLNQCADSEFRYFEVSPETSRELRAYIRSLQPSHEPCAHPWEHIGISGDGHPFCAACCTNLVKDPPWVTAQPPGDVG